MRYVVVGYISTINPPWLYFACCSVTSLDPFYCHSPCVKSLRDETKCNTASFAFTVTLQRQWFVTDNMLKEFKTREYSEPQWAKYTLLVATHVQAFRTSATTKILQDGDGCHHTAETKGIFSLLTTLSTRASPLKHFLALKPARYTYC